MDIDETEEFEEDELRSASEIAKRAIIVANLVTVAYDEKPVNEVIDWLKKENLYDELSPYEQKFLDNSKDEQLGINISWRSEALVILLWSIGNIKDIPPMTEVVENSLFKDKVIFAPAPTSEYINSSTLRDEDEIFEKYDEVHSAHWSVVDARINDKPPPNNLNSGIVYERHFGFNYVVGYMGLPWDEITTDT